MDLESIVTGPKYLGNLIGSQSFKKGLDVMDCTMVLGDYVCAWLETFKKNSIKSASFDRLVTSVSALKDYKIALMPIKDITFFDIQRYVNELVDKGYALTTIKKQVQIVTAPLKQAAAMHVIQSDPCCGVVLPSPHKVKKKPRDISAYTTDEQNRLNSVIDRFGKIGYLCVGVMMETGLRSGEALALSWKNVDIPRRRLRVSATVVNLANKKQSFVQDSPKSISSIRCIPLTDRAVELLMKSKELSEGQWVFQGDGDHLSYEALRYQTKQLCELSGVPYYGDHVFRHTFATNCYHKGVDVKILSKLLGHSDTSVTYNVYVHLYGDSFEEMRAALNR